MHELGCPFKPYTCPKCKKTNLLLSFILQHKNFCEHEETSCPECNLIVIRKELEEHSKTNCLYNLTSCLSCKMIISNKTLNEHSINCRINWSCKTSRTSHLFKHKYVTNKPFKRITRWKKLTNNYYLFHYNFKHLHVQNMKTSETFIKELYICNYRVDAAFHQNYIFVCGGKDKEFLDTCAILNLESKAIDKSKKMREKRSNLSLISTGIFLFCLGGFNDEFVRTCEYFNKEKLKWIIMNSLNNPDFGITSSFDSQKYIYAFGGFHIK